MEHQCTTTYHLLTNGVVKILLGIHSMIKEDKGVLKAKMVYGEPLHLLGHIIEGDGQQDISWFVEKLWKQIKTLRPACTNNRGQKPVFVFKDLATALDVYI
ncbi:hypothetical protein KM043_014373 [Ampulex compressa]|nr:hypothetical protein KM043_014373 [Ampulex compressa]